MLVLILLACGAPDLEDAQLEAAELYCDRAVECDWIPVAQSDECIDTMHPIFSLAWAQFLCEDKIERREWKDCEYALERMDCDDEVWGINNIPGECDESILCNG
jgi:hypothetical protein